MCKGQPVSNSLSVERFLKSEDATLVRDELDKMMTSPLFNTKSTYSPASVGELSFVDKHMKYLSQHPTLNHQQYLSNLRLKTRI